MIPVDCQWQPTEACRVVEFVQPSSPGHAAMWSGGNQEHLQKHRNAHEEKVTGSGTHSRCKRAGDYDALIDWGMG